MILGGYIAKWREYPKDEIKIRVARPSILAPSEGLLRDWKEGRIDWIEFEKRFLDELRSNPVAVKRLLEIATLSKERNVRLICYEKEFPCHRFILIDIVRALQGVATPYHEMLRRYFCA